MFKKDRKITWVVETDGPETHVKNKSKPKFSNPYPNAKYLVIYAHWYYWLKSFTWYTDFNYFITIIGFVEMIFRFCKIWVDQSFNQTQFNKCIRFTLAIIIPFFLVYGLLFTTASVLKVVHSKMWSVFLPYQTNIGEFYWGLAVVGLVLIINSIYGIYGIYGKRVWSTRVFAVISYIYGHASMTVSVTWILLVQIESSDTTFFNKIQRDWYKHNHSHHLKNQDVQDPSSLRNNPFLFSINAIVLFQSLVFILTGILTATLLIKDQEKKGFVDL